MAYSSGSNEMRAAVFCLILFAITPIAIEAGIGRAIAKILTKAPESTKSGDNGSDQEKGSSMCLSEVGRRCQRCLGCKQFTRLWILYRHQVAFNQAPKDTKALASQVNQKSSRAATYGATVLRADVCSCLTPLFMETILAAHHRRH
ncbi:hypothetical protein MTO96_003577 [Rhipicephalus appendiculatus]